MTKAVDATRDCVRLGREARTTLSRERTQRKVRERPPTREEQALAKQARRTAASLLKVAIEIADSVDLLAKTEERSTLHAACRQVRNLANKE